jgi:hypothetical protein
MTDDLRADLRILLESVVLENVHVDEGGNLAVWLAGFAAVKQLNALREYVGLWPYENAPQ